MSGMKKENVWIRGSYRREGRGGEQWSLPSARPTLDQGSVGGGTRALVTATVRGVEAEVGGRWVLTSSSDEGRGSVCRKLVVELSFGAHACDPRGQGRKTVSSRQT